MKRGSSKNWKERLGASELQTLAGKGRNTFVKLKTAFNREGAESAVISICRKLGMGK